MYTRGKIATRLHVVLMKNDILSVSWSVILESLAHILKNSHVPGPSSITRKNLAYIFIDKQQADSYATYCNDVRASSNCAIKSGERIAPSLSQTNLFVSR